VVARFSTLWCELHRFLPALPSSEGSSDQRGEGNHHARRFGSSKYGNRFAPSRVLMDLLTVWFMKRFLTDPCMSFGLRRLASLAVGAGDQPWFYWAKADLRCRYRQPARCCRGRSRHLARRPSCLHIRPAAELQMPAPITKARVGRSTGWRDTCAASQWQRQRLSAGLPRIGPAPRGRAGHPWIGIRRPRRRKGSTERSPDRRPGGWPARPIVASAAKGDSGFAQEPVASAAHTALNDPNSKSSGPLAQQWPCPGSWSWSWSLVFCDQTGRRQARPGLVPSPAEARWPRPERPSSQANIEKCGDQDALKTPSAEELHGG